MSKVTRKHFIVICLIFSLSIPGFAQKYQRSFYGEDNFRNPIRIPASIQDKIKKDWQIRCTRQNIDEAFSTDWFEATLIHLNNDRFSDLLVKAKDPNECFNGNAVSFWAFAKKGRNYNQVFYAYTLSFEVERKISNGYFELWTGRCTANSCLNTVFAFKRGKYHKTREWWKPVTVN